MNIENSTRITKEDLIQTIKDQNLMLLRAQDREIGLLQELNSIKAGNDREKLVVELAVIKSSFSYKIGLILTAPFRAISFLWQKFIIFAWRSARRIKRLLLK